MKKTAFVTGTTAGFGLAIAHRLANLDYRLVITGRRSERLEELKKELEQKGVEIFSLCFDVRDYQACKKAVESLPDNFKNIALLVNNAGLAAGSAPFNECLLDDFEKMIDTNVKGLIYITKLIVPQMVERKSGHIINISSIAGIEVYPNGNIYCATKHAVNAISKGLRLDLVDKNIKISTISPGMAETEFSIVRYHGDEEKAKAVYQGINALNAEDIADALEFIVTRPEHVCINDIFLTPTQQANTFLTFRK